MTYLNDNIARVAAFGDVSGLNFKKDPARMDYLLKIMRNHFSDEVIATHFNWRNCMRPVSPDDIPLLGPLYNYPNVYVNGGHGGKGSTFPLSSGHYIAQLIGKGRCDDFTQAESEIMSPRRFGI